MTAAEGIAITLALTLREQKIPKKELDKWARTWYSFMRSRFVAIPPEAEFVVLVIEAYKGAK